MKKVFLIMAMVMLLVSCTSNNRNNNTEMNNNVNQTVNNDIDATPSADNDSSSDEIVVETQTVKGLFYDYTIEVPIQNPIVEDSLVSAERSGYSKLISMNNCFIFIGEYSERNKDEENFDVDSIETVNDIFENAREHLRKSMRGEVWIESQQYSDMKEEWLQIDDESTANISGNEFNILKGYVNAVDFNSKNMTIPFYAYTTMVDGNPVYFFMYAYTVELLDQYAPVMDDIMNSYQPQ